MVLVAALSALDGLTLLISQGFTTMGLMGWGRMRR